MKILVTGARGYIGSRFISCALTNGHKIVEASREQRGAATQWWPFDLNRSSTHALPEGIDAVIHLAANTTNEEIDEQVEVAAAKNLITKADVVDAKFIFVSSQAAREEAPTSYGRIKWRIEQEVLAASGVVVRLGQVYGGPEMGLFGSLLCSIRRSFILPAFIPSPLVQPIHIEDSVEGLLNLVVGKGTRSGVYCLASPVPITFTKFIQSMARNRARVLRFYVPIPVILIRAFIIIVGSKFTTKLGLHRLISLFELPVMDTTMDLDDIGLQLRTLTSGMQRSGSDRRRRLIHEGSALLAYLLKEKPNSRLVRRYVRMVEMLRSGTPLNITPWLLNLPICLALLDTPADCESPTRNEFRWRLDAATVIAEASTQGAARFLGPTRSTRQLLAITRLTIAVISELAWRMLRFIFPSLLRRLVKRRRS